MGVVRKTVSIACFDLRPGQSLAGFLVGLGRPVYVVDYGDITFADRRMGFEDWYDDIVPSVIQRVSDEHGGADVHLIGWSLGGTISYLTGAAHPELRGQQGIVDRLTRPDVEHDELVLQPLVSVVGQRDDGPGPGVGRLGRLRRHVRRAPLGWRG